MNNVSRTDLQLHWQRVAGALLLSTAGAVLLALSALVRIPLPSGVPVTLQVLAVIILGGWLGPWLGLAAVCQYLLFGLCGLPIFAGGTLFGVTGGFLLGFLPAVVVVGLLYAPYAHGSYRRRLAGSMLAGVAGMLVIYLVGWTWLSLWFRFVTIDHQAGMAAMLLAFTVGVKPFILVDLCKSAVAAAAFSLRRAEKG